MTATPDPAGLRLLSSQRELRERIAVLAGDIADVYDASLSPPVLVAVLKGSSFFLADLIRAMPLDLTVDFMSISSYGEARPGVVRVIKDLDEDIAGRDVLLVEDIVDTGFTLNFLRKSLLQREPRSLRTVTLLDKAARRIVPVDIEFRGFEIEDLFVVGYGLDFQGLYRNVPDLYAVSDVAALARRPDLLVSHFFEVAISEC
ncbi:MAG: hypoxanthine phosphoribosyltransferase [Actinomycetota bacterium]